jgi:hypothetical protein
MRMMEGDSNLGPAVLEYEDIFDTGQNGQLPGSVDDRVSDRGETLIWEL